MISLQVENDLDPESFASRNHLCLPGECEDVDEAGAVGEHLGKGVLPQARLHELAARQETSASRIHLSENLLCSRSRNLPRLLQGRSFSGSRCHHLEYSSCYLGHLLRLYHPVVVNVKQPKGPGQLLLLAAIGDNVQGQHVFPEVDDTVPVAVEGAKDMSAKVISTVVWEEHRVPGAETFIHSQLEPSRPFFFFITPVVKSMYSNLHGTELFWQQLSTGAMSPEL